MLVACSSTTSGDDNAAPIGDDAGTSDASIFEAGSDASPNNENKNDAGDCVSNCHVNDPCTVGTTCASGICTDDKCVDPSCMDGMKDGTETASDCGGVCTACADNLACIVGGDCTSGVCAPDTKTCAAPTSTDHVQNGTETDTDCGSSGTGEPDTAPACGDGLMCNVAADCLNGLCGANHTCIPSSCSDTILNGTETAVDCGGLCSPCADNVACKVDADCTSDHCDSDGTKLCLPPTSNDGRTNGNETDVDCGSSGKGENTHADPCPDNDICAKGTDCLDGVCGANLVCAAPSCHDSVQNGGETDVDCGDNIITGCAPCADTKKCNPADTPSDCASLVCTGTGTAGTCTKATSTDGIQNGKESDVDCGSSGTGEDTSAPACPDYINKVTRQVSKCSVGSDCKSGFCNATEKQCVDGASCAMPAPTKASKILDIKTAAKTTSPTTNDAMDAVGTPNVNGAGLYAGVDTCGVGEATDVPSQRNLESCCKSLDVAATGDRVDKYEVTSGRMRQFIESINAEAAYSGYNIKQWVMDQFNADGSPKTAIGTTIYSQIPTPKFTGNATTTTDTRQLFPAAETGTLNAVQQLGGVSMDTGIPSDLQGCFTGVGNAGSSTYWWDAAGEYVVGSPPRPFTQDYYDIKPLNCAMYWMAAAFCAWDGGYLPADAHYQALWGTGNYPWGADMTYPTVSSSGSPAYSRNFQDIGANSSPALSGHNEWVARGTPLITTYTINSLNDNGSGNFYFYPNNGNPAAPTGYAGIPDTIDGMGNGNLGPDFSLDYSPFIAAPGRFVPDVSAYKATASTVYGSYPKAADGSYPAYPGDAWQDLAANLFEYHAMPTSSFASGGIFCDTSGGIANSGTTATTCDSTGGVACTRQSVGGKYLCGYERGSVTGAAALVSRMPAVRWQGGSWEVHPVPVGGYGFQGTYQMNTQYGKAGFRCARKAE